MRSCMSFKCPSLSIHLFNEYHNLMLVWNPANFVLDSWVTYVLSSYFSDIVLDLGFFFGCDFHPLFAVLADVIFLIYVYQRWIYPVDKRRVNEFGFVGEDDQVAEGVEVTATKEEEKKTNWDGFQFWRWGWSGCWWCSGDCYHRGRREENRLRLFSIYQSEPYYSTNCNI